MTTKGDMNLRFLPFLPKINLRAGFLSFSTTNGLTLFTNGRVAPSTIGGETLEKHGVTHIRLIRIY
jgi:hypothetical protein